MPSVKALLPLLMLFSAGCAPRYFLFSEQQDYTEHDSSDIVLDERKFNPYDSFQEKRLRLAFHYFNNPDSTLNYNRDKGLEVATALIVSANERMARNEKMLLPAGNNIAVSDTKIRYVLHMVDGIPEVHYYYHDDPEYFIKKGKKSNRYDRSVLNKYGNIKDSVINVLVMPYHPDQLNSGEQSLEKTAIALGSSIKLPGLFQSKEPIWAFAGIFNHEMGHILGLKHTWDSNDGCDDTPRHDNCWNGTDENPCSNNLMDYNAHQSAITPCQIARMHATLANPASLVYKAQVDDYCIHKTGSTISIDEFELWNAPVQIRENVIVETKGALKITSIVHMSNHAKIIIKKGGILILENATFLNSCGDQWGGIYFHKKADIILRGTGFYDLAKNRDLPSVIKL